MSTNNTIELKYFSSDNSSSRIIQYNSSSSATFLALQEIYNSMISYVEENPDSYQNLIDGITKDKINEITDIEKLKKDSRCINFTDKKSVFETGVYRYLKYLIPYYSIFEEDGNIDESNLTPGEIISFTHDITLKDYYIPYCIPSNSKLWNALQSFCNSAQITVGYSQKIGNIYNLEGNFFIADEINKYYLFIVASDENGRITARTDIYHDTNGFLNKLESLYKNGNCLFNGCRISKTNPNIGGASEFKINGTNFVSQTERMLASVITYVATHSKNYSKIKNGRPPFFSENRKYYMGDIILPYEGNLNLEYYDNILKSAVTNFITYIREIISKQPEGAEEALAAGYHSSKLDSYINNSGNNNAKLYNELIYASGNNDGYINYTEISQSEIDSEYDQDYSFVSKVPKKIKYTEFAKNKMKSISRGSFEENYMMLEDVEKKNTVQNCKGELLAYYTLFTCFYYDKNDSVKKVLGMNTSSELKYERKYTIYNGSNNTSSHIPPVYTAESQSNNLVKNATSDEDAIKKIYVGLKDALKKIIDGKLKEIKIPRTKSDQSENGTKSVDSSEFEEYTNSRLTNHIIEKDYFYINTTSDRKHIPDTPFVEIQFKVPHLEDPVNNNYTWISVTNPNGPSVSVMNSIPGDSTEADFFYMESNNYFDGFTLTDSGYGAKSIELNLKSLDNFNLEKIIMNSLSYTNGGYNIVSQNTGSNIDSVRGIADDYGTIKGLLDNASSHFRIRFGYRNLANSQFKGNVVDTTDKNSQDFKSRDSMPDNNVYRPTISYPWTYFMITDFSSDIVGDSTEFKIKGQEVGGYILKDLSLAGLGTDLSFSSTVDKSDSRIGTANNVVGTIANYLKRASDVWSGMDNTPAIYILGSDNNTILTGWNNSDSHFTTLGFKTVGENPAQDLKSDLDFESQFYPGTSGENIISRNFTTATDDNYSIMSIENLLDKVCEWLPERVYILKENVDTGKMYAARQTYSQIESYGSDLKSFFENHAHAVEKPKYQIIEQEIEINGTKRDAILIKIYFTGPKIKGNEATNPIRVYSYKAGMTPLIKSLSFENSMNFSKATSAVNLLGEGVPLMFLNNNKDSKINTDPVGLNGDTVFFSSSQVKKIIYAPSSDSTSDTERDYKNSMIMSASRYFKELKKAAQTGEITILGDPFYYFDSIVEPANYEIYINANRIRDLKSASKAQAFYSGIYQVDGIEHSMTSNGEFETKLKIHKEIF